MRESAGVSRLKKGEKRPSFLGVSSLRALVCDGSLFAGDVSDVSDAQVDIGSKARKQGSKEVIKRTSCCQRDQWLSPPAMPLVGGGLSHSFTEQQAAQ